MLNALKVKLTRPHAFAVLALAYGVFLAGIHRVPVPTVDGAVRAVEARNMLETGQLWPVIYQNAPVTDHPPLFIWLTALSFKVFGATDFAANIVPRIFAFLTVGATALVAIEAGATAGQALLAALLLCATRDFVLSSVRGYLEPLLEFFIYVGLWLTLRQKKERTAWPACVAGVVVWFAVFSKGPVALWPLLFFGFVLFWNGSTARRRLRLLAAYFGSTLACALVWAAWVEHKDQWPLWHAYLTNQVLGSALTGRGGAQSYEPLYFAKILGKYYWPLLPLLLWSTYRMVRRALALDFSSRNSYAAIFAVFGWGFVIAFSLMKWKFWYYIAPAYPAFAALIAISLPRLKALERPAAAKWIAALGAAWIVVATAFPIPLHRERVPEVMDFKDAITRDAAAGETVWFVRNPRDHNQIGTSGEWYFKKRVEKVVDEKAWMASRLVAPSWILTGAETLKECKNIDWCARSRVVQTSGASALLYYEK